jgi:hypothetical protein
MERERKSCEELLGMVCKTSNLFSDPERDVEIKGKGRNRWGGRKARVSITYAEIGEESFKVGVLRR